MLFPGGSQDRTIEIKGLPLQLALPRCAPASAGLDRVVQMTI